jgi:hypothetical protein
LLRRGHILLIAGGAAVAIGFSMLGYYGVRLIETLEREERFMIEPNGSAELKQNITAVGQGAYVASFPEFTGGEPVVTIRDPQDRLVLQRSVPPPIVLEAFPVAEAGVYTLTMSNPSEDSVLEAVMIMGNNEAVLSRAGSLSLELTVAFGFILVAGAAAAVAGAVITILDKRRISKMKQFGDTSDLV